MVWEDYLALLSWQGCKVFCNDFKKLKRTSIQSIEDIKDICSHPDSKIFLNKHPDWWKRAESDYKKCYGRGYKITWPGKKDYPLAFFKLNRPPVILTYLGSLSQNEEGYFPLTFVGSRESQDMVFEWMDFYLPKVVKEKKICLVSGGARGVDQKAHCIAVRIKFPTVCFLPSGLNCFYPSSLHGLKKSILDYGGAFVSCFHPDTPMYKSFFHIRNQLMACYSKLVCVGQAQMRSGTMLTAQKALNYGVSVAVLPGPPLSVSWGGNLQLLYDGAFLIRDDVDLFLLVESLKMSN